MCEQCSAGCKTYNKTIFDKYWLVVATHNGTVMEKGDFGLVTCNDPDFLFETIIQAAEDTDDEDLEFDQIEDCFDWFNNVFCIYPERTQNTAIMVTWSEFHNAYKSVYGEPENCFDIINNLLKEIHQAIDSGFIPEDQED